MAEIQKAAEAASANDFIQKLEEKYDSMIGHLYWVGLGKKPKNHLFERVVVKGAVNIERVLFFQMTFATKIWTNPPSHGKNGTPWKINMEPSNHPFRKENDLPTSMIMFHVNLQGCKSFISSEFFLFLPEVKVGLGSVEGNGNE